LSSEDIADLAQTAINLREAHNNPRVRLENPPSLRPIMRIIGKMGRYEVSALDVEKELQDALVVNTARDPREFAKVVNASLPLRRLRIRHASQIYSRIQGMPEGFDKSLSVTLLRFWRGIPACCYRTMTFRA